MASIPRAGISGARDAAPPERGTEVRASEELGSGVDISSGGKLWTSRLHKK
ncbi:MAG: hypothetical protein ACK50D_11920 [Burkholderiales bacterium]|nr:hypothetical protein [Nitrosomonadaceae bacterium]